MAGLGRKVFTAGDVLTASDVQNYLMDQTVMNFAGTAARSSAIATPTTGMTTYNQTTQQLETYNGSAYIGMSGLQLIKKQTVGSAVSSITISNAFNATFPSYKVLYTGGTQSASSSISISISGITTGYYTNLIFSAYGTPNTVAGAGNANQSTWAWGGGGTTTGAGAEFEIHQPFATQPKWGRSTYIQISTTGQTGTAYWYNASTTSSTDLIFTPSSGTLTGGTIYVYGYGI